MATHTLQPHTLLEVGPHLIPHHGHFWTLSPSQTVATTGMAIQAATGVKVKDRWTAGRDRKKWAGPEH